MFKTIGSLFLVVVAGVAFSGGSDTKETHNDHSAKVSQVQSDSSSSSESSSLVNDNTNRDITINKVANDEFKVTANNDTTIRVDNDENAEVIAQLDSNVFDNGDGKKKIIIPIKKGQTIDITIEAAANDKMVTINNQTVLSDSNV